MNVRKILWPTDFSAYSQAALAQVKSLTEKYGAEVHVLYVIEDIAHHPPWYGEFGNANVDRLMEWAKETASRRLNQICEKYLEGCPLYFKHVAVGDPAGEILEFIGREGIDLVVMPTRGEKGKFFFGSVAEKVVKNAKVPVVTVPVSV